MPVPVSNLQAVNPTAIIELFELELNSVMHGIDITYRFHNGSSQNENRKIIWAGNTYLRYPVEADGFEYNGAGQLPRPNITISNALTLISAAILTTPEGLEGAKLTRIRTLARFIDIGNFEPIQNLLVAQDGDNLQLQQNDDILASSEIIHPYGNPDPTQELPREVYFLDRKVVENREIVSYECAAAFDLAGVRAPKRQALSNLCQWVYKSAECGYAGALPTCSKTLADCTGHFGGAQLPFGGFPGVGGFK